MDTMDNIDKMDAAKPAEGPRRYDLKPAKNGSTLPKRVEKLLKRSLQMKADAGKKYAEADELLERALKETTGSGANRKRVIEFGTVYELSDPLTLDGRIKRTIMVCDNFELAELTKAVKFKRYDVKTWANGPKEKGAEA